MKKNPINVYDKSSWKDESINRIRGAIGNKIIYEVKCICNGFETKHQSNLYKFYEEVSKDENLIKEFDISIKCNIDDEIIKIFDEIIAIWNSDDYIRDLRVCELVSDKAIDVKEYIDEGFVFDIIGNSAFDFAYELYEKTIELQDEIDTYSISDDDYHYC